MSAMWMPFMGTNDVGVAPLVFSFLTNGTSAPSESEIRGNKVSSITYDSTGKWIVTLVDGYYEIIGAWAHMAAPSTGADLIVPRVYFPDEAADPLVLHVLTSNESDTLANPAADRRITVCLWIKTSRGA